MGDWVSLVFFSYRQPSTFNWHEISWIDCLFFCCCCCFLYVVWEWGLPRKFARFILFRLIKKRSFKSLVCFGSFSKLWQSTLFRTTVRAVHRKMRQVLASIHKWRCGRLFFNSLALPRPGVKPTPLDYSPTCSSQMKPTLSFPHRNLAEIKRSKQVVFNAFNCNN